MAIRKEHKNVVILLFIAGLVSAFVITNFVEKFRAGIIYVTLAGISLLFYLNWDRLK